MNRLNQTLKKCVAFGVTGIMLILAGCKSPAGFASNDNEEYNARMEEARTTPRIIFKKVSDSSSFKV